MKIPIKHKTSAGAKKLLAANIKSDNELMRMKRIISKQLGIPILKNSEILAEYKLLLKLPSAKPSPELEKILRKRSIRTMSGIAPIAVLTKPYPCPGKCIYCPTEKNVPQSYLSNEPAVMRAIRCGYDPYKQVGLRLQSLENNGHCPTKIELIVIGGTWSALPKNYKHWFILRCFEAANNYGKKSRKSKVESRKYNAKLKINSLSLALKSEQKKNEMADYKIIGITLETRPDYINHGELLEMRELGCTRVELGVQAIDDKILKINRRGHGVKEIAEATKLLKNFGFKVTYHLMPGLPGSSPKKDLTMFKQLFLDERFQPDQIKFYPTVVTKGSLLYRWWKNGKYKPYNGIQLRKLIVMSKGCVPPYVRIIRLIRDIPGESIMAGNQITNLRQIMKDLGTECGCIRCREARDQKFKMSDAKLKIIDYHGSGGIEYFISYESADKKILFGFCRLRIPGDQLLSHLPTGLNGAALIRELHVYGELTPFGKKGKVQHIGLGKNLMAKAEELAVKHNYSTIAVISGVGVRGYYKNLGYSLRNTYMIKKIQ